MERPILFRTAMVQAILAGRKTQTRRLVKIPDIVKAPDRFVYVGNSNQIEIPRKAIPYDERLYHEWTLTNNNSCSWVDCCPYGKPGDILWVREKWGTHPPYDDKMPSVICGDSNPYVIHKSGFKTPAIFFAGTENNAWGMYGEPKWKPSIHMPRTACRIRLKVKDIRVERLQDISKVDAAAEGVLPEKWQDHPGYHDYLNPEGWFTNPKWSFCSLWQSIHGEESWNFNPWLWVVEFERIKS